jgi:predicted ribosome quality control (RQC) complex YloA/Tae2 family protein
MAVAGPKRELTAFDVLALVDELGETLGAHIEKIFQHSFGELVIRLRMPGKGGRELVVRDGKWLFLREKEASEGPPPPPFAMLLRKHLENRSLRSIEQKGFERIVVLGFEGYELVVELFGQGNVILVNEGNIVQPMRNQSWEHREVRPGRPYVFPPPRIDPRSLGSGEFAGILAASKGDLVRTLAVPFNLGGRYAEEVCARTGLDKNMKVGKLPSGISDRLHSAVMGILDEVAQKRQPVLVLDGSSPVDFSPVPMKINEGRATQPFPSMNAVIVHYTGYWQQKRYVEESSRPALEQLDKLRRQLESQQIAVKEYEGKAALGRRTALAVSASIEGLAALLDEVREVKQAGGWDAVSKAIRENKLPPAVKEASPAECGVVVQLTDADGGMSAVLDLRKSARENASAYFAAYKDALEKAKRTIELLEGVREKIRDLEEGGPAHTKEVPKARRKRKLEWFERYRWFISTDGNIVVAGKDAGSNDRIVKRHLKEGDAYAHADLHGAPSVAIKRQSVPIPERTLREACQFALAYSKAWAAGLASGSAYWTTPDQVSKTPETGEYLPKGGFIVRGRKNFYHDLGMELTIGWIERAGDKVLMGGPKDAFSSSEGDKIVIQPGEEDAKTLARRICEKLGCELEEAIRLLPPGKSKISAQ